MLEQYSLLGILFPVLRLNSSLNDPVNGIAAYWQNNSCNPFFGPTGKCELGNSAPYAIKVTSKDDVIAGINFAQKNNIRLTIKNTGHDFQGRSVGAGSLALWTHNLKNVDFFNYASRAYNGPAARVGAGVGSQELLMAANAHGYRAVTGSCATVGVAGGYSQGGGHGALSSKYGLGADQVLEWEVVTAKGQYLTVSPSKNADLYWALSGGGAGNYAVVLSMTVKVYPDGPVAGASFAIFNTNDTAYWAAMTAWFKHMLILDNIPGFNSIWSLTGSRFYLVYASLPDGTVADINKALDPVIAEIQALNVSVAHQSALHPNYAQSWSTFLPQPYDTNNTGGGRMIPRAVMQKNVTAVVSTLRAMCKMGDGIGTYQINGIGANVTNQRVGNAPGSNAVIPAWRDMLFTMIFGFGWEETADWSTISARQKAVNVWQDMLRQITPGGGTYMNEATYDNPNWKEDYYGKNYDALLRVKRTYDPDGFFWGNTAVGSDSWQLTADKRLCRAW